MSGTVAIVHAKKPLSLRWGTLVALLCLPLLLAAQEICDNGVDDDGNGLIDLNDSLACPCDLLPPSGNLITNGSFEDHTCCPGDDPNWPLVDVDCADNWTNYMVSSSSDYYGCDYLPAAIPQPLPDGGGLAGFGASIDWSGNNYSYEFLVQCLANPLITGQTYQLSFTMAAARTSTAPAINAGLNMPVDFGPIDMAIYGIDTCPSSPYVEYDPIFGNPLPADRCPTELGWVELGRITYNPANAWQELDFTFEAPFDAAAILFGPACPIPSDYISYNTSWPYFFVDNMGLVTAELAVSSTGHPCTNNLVLNGAPYDAPPNLYQWYLDGVAIVGQTGETLDASALGLGGGVYTLRMIRPDGSCVLAQKEIAAEYPEPLASANPASGCAPLVVQFNNGTDPALSGSVLWDLGDGSTHAGNSFNHTYNQPGTYDVRLTVTSAEGCTSDSLFEGLVTVHPKPVASFVADTTVGCVGLPVTFSGTAQPPGNYTYAWSFGDGIVGSGNPVTHTYANAGTYNVMLVATSEFGCSGEVTAPQFIQILPTPAPAFTADPATGCIPLNVRFNNNTPNEDGMAASWDLGNGSTSSESSPTTTYTQPGTYTVSLTMTNQAGCSATFTDSAAVTAYEPPVVTFTVDPDEGCAPLRVRFSNTTDPGMIGACAWDFGDGQTGGDCMADHTYAQPGTYNVALHVTSTVGCEGDTTLYNIIHVLPNPVAFFGLQPLPAEISEPVVTFRDSSSMDVVSWSWTFPHGDPPDAQTANATVTFPGDAPGVYPVELIVTNAYGCTDTITRNALVNGELTVYVPNAFTPDGDGINDALVPVLRDADPRFYEFRVFDRWGAEIFSSSAIGEGWDGTVNGVEPKTDVYNWMLRVKSAFNAETRSYRGMVVLLK